MTPNIHRFIVKHEHASKGCRVCVEVYAVASFEILAAGEEGGSLILLTDEGFLLILWGHYTICYEVPI